MKKIFLMLTVAAFTASFVACDSKKSETGASDQDSTNVEVVTPAAEGDALAKYTELVEKAVALYPKVKTGDASAVQEYTKVAQDIANMSQDLQKELANMTPEQAAKFAEISKKFADAAAQ
ncbi:hypothetical protein [Dysgonomonas macrotermitis]|uniref:Lipoprotein n=1 Tax=Dysgonomonas macrotermitis TaxID=1346286 RepID=A0A1M5HF41_9BACT|nr:hypothetical protein [Dysgonomonas macrotermitis]SHG14508.1 hypothetical protein SAMN05444362_11646 [Dysgonomonas macrotermitis]